MCVFMIFYYIIQDGGSFLQTCGWNGRTDICHFLISKGANVNQVDKVSIVFHYSCVTTTNIYRIYPFCKDVYNTCHTVKSGFKVHTLVVSKYAHISKLQYISIKR